MNPFGWTGPHFLVFYVVLAVVVIVALRVLRKRRESADAGYRGTPIHDPYAIAFLRGGKHELVRVAVVALVDRGLLWVKDDQVVTTVADRSTSVRRRIEKDLLAFCETPREAKELFAFGFDTAATELELELSQMGLLPDEETKRVRQNLFSVGAAVLLFFSAVKIAVALSRGRTNVSLLIVLTLFSIGALQRAVVPGLTPRGKAFLREMENLFRSLKLRATQLRPGGATSEVAMLAAVWGLTALPAPFSWSYKLFQKATSDSTMGSCGSSCGSGCGGGGCGGGCGGCGG